MSTPLSPSPLKYSLQTIPLLKLLHYLSKKELKQHLTDTQVDKSSKISCASAKLFKQHFASNPHLEKSLRISPLGEQAFAKYTQAVIRLHHYSFKPHHQATSCNAPTSPVEQVALHQSRFKPHHQATSSNATSPVEQVALHQSLLKAPDNNLNQSNATLEGQTALCLDQTPTSPNATITYDPETQCYIRETDHFISIIDSKLGAEELKGILHQPDITQPYRFNHQKTAPQRQYQTTIRHHPFESSNQNLKSPEWRSQQQCQTTRHHPFKSSNRTPKSPKHSSHMPKPVSSQVSQSSKHHSHMPKPQVSQSSKHHSHMSKPVSSQVSQSSKHHSHMPKPQVSQSSKHHSHMPVSSQMTRYQPPPLRKMNQQHK